MALVKLKSVRDTYLYQAINTNNEFDKIIKTFLEKGIVVQPDMLKQAYGTIENYFKFPLKVSIMDALKDGIIVPMMLPKGIAGNVKIPTSIPFIMRQKGGSIQAIAVIDNWARISDDNHTVEIEPIKLYTFLEGAFIARQIQGSFGSIRHNTTFYTEGSFIYSHMFARVLNRDYALNVNKDAYGKVLFLAAKFFLLNLLQMEDSELVFNYASKAAGNASPVALKRVNDAFPQDGYKDISSFIHGLSTIGYHITAGLNELTVRDYTMKYVKMYNNSSLFALEHISYFIFSLVACINRAHLNDIYAWDAAIGTKSGDKLYAYISNAVRR